MNRQEMTLNFDEPAMSPCEVALDSDVQKATACVRAALAELAKMTPAAVGVGQIVMDAEDALECALDRLQF